MLISQTKMWSAQILWCFESKCNLQCLPAEFVVKWYYIYCICKFKWQSYLHLVALKVRTDENIKRENVWVIIHKRKRAWLHFLKIRHLHLKTFSTLYPSQAQQWEDLQHNIQCLILSLIYNSLLNGVKNSWTTCKFTTWALSQWFPVVFEEVPGGPQ